MKVMVSGGTGFVGSHSVDALLRAGHQVRLLVRSPEKVGPALEPLGHTAEDVEVVAGDLLDATSVGRALEGTDAVLHAASTFSLDPRDAALMHRVNVEGTRHLLQRAVALGLDPIVHVSSVVALQRTGVDVIDIGPDAPVGNLDVAYAGSKARQEAEVRQLQADGAPVVITYPGGVFGPHDPHFGEQGELTRNIVRGRTMAVTRGDVMVVDVRDVAAVHAALFEPSRGARRYLAAGHVVPVVELARMICRIAGVRRPVMAVPDGMAIAVGRAVDRLQRRVRTRLPASYEQALLGTLHNRVDNSRTEAELGVTFRPVEETLRSQIAWQRAVGRL